MSPVTPLGKGAAVHLGFLGSMCLAEGEDVGGSYVPSLVDHG